MMESTKKIEDQSIILSDAEVELYGALYNRQPADLRATVTFERYLRCRMMGIVEEQDSLATEPPRVRVDRVPLFVATEDLHGRHPAFVSRYFPSVYRDVVIDLLDDGSELN